ncbi:MAG: hypothetical protein ACYCVH_05840 [Ignavibacteriaceae bacterium]
MKKFLFPFLLIFLIRPVYSQDALYPRQGEGYFDGGMGLNWIDGELYYSFHFRPEVSFANFGVGLDLNFDINRNGNIRKENFNELSDYLSIIRYIRYGMKNDPVYIKLGALDYYTLGHGSIISEYNNSPSYDTRKIGLVADIDFGNFGFESIYSNFLEAGVVGVRGYVRPLKYTTLGDIPIIGNLTVGATYATDFNKYAGIVFSEGFLPTANKFPSTYLITSDKGAINIIGADIGLPIFSTSVAALTLYSDFTKIINFGSGIATGIKFDLNSLNLVRGTVKLERRFNSAQYIPSYFNSLYEVERYKFDTTSQTFSSKITTLTNMTSPDNGYFGELDVNALGLFYVIGSYERLDKTPNSGRLHIDAEAMPQSLPVMARAGYDKINITNEKDIFTLDDRSYLYFEFGYKPMPYLLVSILYKWTFTPIRDADNNVIDYQPQKRIEPRVSFVYPFSFGQ